MTGLEWGTETAVFAIIAGVATALLLVSVFAGHDFDIGFLHADNDILPGLNVTSILAFLAVFGAVAWAMSGYYDVSPAISSLSGAVAGASIGLPLVYLYKTMKGQAGTTSAANADFIGQLGVLTIVPGEAGIGEVQVTLEGREAHRFRARFAEPDKGTKLGEGATVRVEQLNDGVALVTPV